MNKPWHIQLQRFDEVLFCPYFPQLTSRVGRGRAHRRSFRYSNASNVTLEGLDTLPTDHEEEQRNVTSDSKITVYEAQGRF